MFPIKVDEAGAPGSARVSRAGFGVLAKIIFFAGAAVFEKFATARHRPQQRDARATQSAGLSRLGVVVSR